MMTKLNTVLRTHIKNTQRLEVLKKTIKSWYAQEMNFLGDLYIVDDQSPMQNEVIHLVNRYNAHYLRTTGEGDTKNGLYWSLRVQNQWPVLCCVDDMVFGKGSRERFEKIISSEIPELGKFGMFGSFACYENNTRDFNRIIGTDYWKVPIDILYGLVCHIYSRELSNIITKEWEGIQKGNYPMPNCCDDIWVKEICRREQLPVYNSYRDFAQHTGMNMRTFGENEVTESSEYQTPCFVGE